MDPYAEDRAALWAEVDRRLLASLADGLHPAACCGGLDAHLPDCDASAWLGEPE